MHSQYIHLCSQGSFHLRTRRMLFHLVYLLGLLHFDTPGSWRIAAGSCIGDVVAHNKLTGRAATSPAAAATGCLLHGVMMSVPSKPPSSATICSHERNIRLSAIVICCLMCRPYQHLQEQNASFKTLLIPSMLIHTQRDGCALNAHAQRWAIIFVRHTGTLSDCIQAAYMTWMGG
jgi:hypothetical protein